LIGLEQQKTGTGKPNNMNLDKAFLHGCAGKKKHKTYLSAEVYLDEKHHGTGAHIYRCKICSHFHIGHPKKVKVKKIKHKQNRKDINDKQHKHKLKRFKY
jgi:hypothetical protein